MPRPVIVTIDDEMEFAKALAQYFTPRGYDVHVALDGRSGIKLVEAKQPDVVLVDLKMPGLDGDATLAQIHRLLPGTKVIIITAYSDEGRTRDRVLALGAFAHFEKPLSSLRHLGEAIEQALGRRA